jgi:hypothetical protein
MYQTRKEDNMDKTYTTDQMITARDILKMLYCNHEGGIVVWPDWLDNPLLIAMEQAGYAYHKFYKHLYGYTAWFIL